MVLYCYTAQRVVESTHHTMPGPKSGRTDCAAETPEQHKWFTSCNIILIRHYNIIIITLIVLQLASAGVQYE